MKIAIHEITSNRASSEEDLKAYSEAGGTHHAAIAYGDVVRELSSFGRMMGWQVIVIE